MLKDLLKKELRQFCLGPKTSGALECPAYDQTLVWEGHVNGADRRTAPHQGTGRSFDPHNVLATARAALGM